MTNVLFINKEFTSNATFFFFLIRATLAKDLLAAFNWSCLLLKNGFKVEANCSGDSFNQLVEAQANLYTSIATSKSKKLIDRACYRYSSFLHLHLIFDLLIDLNFLD